MNFEEALEKISGMAETHGGKLNAKVNFKFDEGVIHLDDTVSPTVVKSEDISAACVVKMSLENFDKLLAGDLNPMMAFMTGKMKIDGDKGIAMKLAGLF
jgi:putative sterol carrier protein